MAFSKGNLVNLRIVQRSMLKYIFLLRKLICMVIKSASYHKVLSAHFCATLSKNTLIAIISCRIAAQLFVYVSDFAGDAKLKLD